jgi:hypothetical protein
LHRGQAAALTPHEVRLNGRRVPEQLDEGSGTRAESTCLVVNDVEVALDSQAFEPYGAESADHKITPDSVNRDEGNP